jgi:hypothetical protein
MALGLVGCATNEINLTVDAGQYERNDTPLSVDAQLSRTQAMNKVYALQKDKILTAQVEHVNPKTSRIHWILPHLDKNTTGEYTIQFGSQDTNCKSQPCFRWKNSSRGKRKSMDLLYGDRPVLRYVHTPFNPQDIKATKKAFHQAFSPDGSRIINKGVGGNGEHHQGIFFGYSKCRFDNTECNIWWSNDGEHLQHLDVLREWTGPVMGGHEVLIAWVDKQGRTFVKETRRVIAFRQPEGQLLIEVITTLRPTKWSVDLSGDRQHAGLHFRAANEVSENADATRFLRPQKWAHLPANEQINTPEHRDLPWNAMQYKLGDQQYTVAYMSDPANPCDATFSERKYGRFGEYFPWKLTEDNPLSVRYRFFITDDPDVTRARIEQKYQEMAQPPKIQIH